MPNLSPTLRYIVIAMAVIFGFISGTEVPLGPDSDPTKIGVITALLSGGILAYLLTGSKKNVGGGITIFFVGLALTFWMVLQHYWLGYIIVRALMSCGGAMMILAAISSYFPGAKDSTAQAKESADKTDSGDTPQ